MNSFKDLGIDPRIVQTLCENNIIDPTDVQRLSIPYFLENKNFVALASTGSGKTLSFLVPLIQNILHMKKKNLLAKALILVPTRELGMQVLKNFDLIRTDINLSASLIIGGKDASKQSKALRKGTDIIIATPGRFLDMWNQGKLILNHVRHLVLDEADRMTDMGFYPDLRRIVSLLHFPIHYSLFSATMPETVEELINSFVYKPEVLKLSSPKKTAPSIDQFLAHIELPKKSAYNNIKYKDFAKRTLLRFLLKKEDPDSAIIFCNRKRDINTLTSSLLRYDFNCISLHGDMSQDNRFKNLDDFKSGKKKILIASDVAARGLDIPSVSHVFNFDIPLSQDDYIHRIGRTGRAGKYGRSFTITLDKKDHNKLTHHVKEVIQPADLEGFTLPDPLNSTAASQKKKRTQDSPNTEQIKGFGDHIPKFFLS